MATKLTVKEQATYRNSLYGVTVQAIEQQGYDTEPFKKGVLIHLPDGQFAKLNISIVNIEKFDLEETRAQYHEQIENRRLADEKAAAKKAEKAERARLAAEKKAAKETDVED